MGKWDILVCAICEYVYDPAIGDPENDIEPWTSFISLPHNWVCPGCGLGKEQFIPYREHVEFERGEDIEV